MAEKFGCPYMGSKGPLAKWVLSKVPKADNIYDLFGGGFAISHCAVLSGKWKNVHYNEIQTDVTDLVKDAISGKYSYERFKPEWISRDEFFRLKDSDAYVRYIWSFGNSGKSYLFGKEIEDLKRSAHQAVVFAEFDKLFVDMFGFNSWSLESIKGRRLYLKKVIAHNKKIKRIDLQQLERLEQLEQLQQLERPNLIISSKDYREVEIKSNSVIYCDPPYIGTASYSEDGFNHDEFYQWVRDNKNPVFISEYNMPDDFKVIASMSKIQKLSSQKENRKYFYETLFANNLGYEMYMDEKMGIIKPTVKIRTNDVLS